MPQHAARRAAAPAELRLAQETIEIFGIEPLEDLVEIEMLAFGPGDELAAADLFDQVGLPADVAAIEVEAIAVGVDGRTGLAVELAEKDMRQGLQHWRRRPGQQVGNADFEAPVLQTDEAVGVGEAAEFDAHLGSGGARFQLAKDALVDCLRRFKKQGTLQALKVYPHASPE